MTQATYKLLATTAVQLGKDVDAYRAKVKSLFPNVDKARKTLMPYYAEAYRVPKSFLTYDSENVAIGFQNVPKKATKDDGARRCGACRKALADLKWAFVSKPKKQKAKRWSAPAFAEGFAAKHTKSQVIAAAKALMEQAKQM